MATIKVKFVGWNLQNTGICNVISKPQDINALTSNPKGIVRGGGQSYGDSAVNFSGNVYLSNINPFHLEPLEDFGDYVVVKAEHKVADLCKYLIGTGRFMEVVPGSAEATIGGCIASDVHGKNDHHYGSFGHSVIAMEILTAEGTFWIERDKSLEYKYFVAGYGLTGIIQTIKLKVRKVSGQKLISQVFITKSLNELFTKINEAENKYEYVIGWADCTRNGISNGFVEAANWSPGSVMSSIENSSRSFSIPNLRINIINSLTIRVYNYLTFKKAYKKSLNGYKEIPYDKFLFPTSSIKNWNKLFGSNGFHEIQINVQEEFISQFIGDIEEISRRYPIFLAGIKKLSKPGLGILSFANPGWSIALNIPGKYISLVEVQTILKQFAGRYHSPQYLTKDSALTVDIFNVMYPQADLFRKFRISSGSDKLFESEMSKRLKL